MHRCGPAGPGPHPVELGASRSSRPFGAEGITAGRWTAARKASRPKNGTSPIGRRRALCATDASRYAGLGGPEARGHALFRAPRLTPGEQGGTSPMLVLTRKSNQSIMIGDDIEVSVLAIMGEKVRIGIQAPRDIPVFRKEVYLEIQQERVGAAKGAREEVDAALRGLSDAR